MAEQRGGYPSPLDITTPEAAAIAGGSQSASTAAHGPEPLNRKERARYNASVRSLETSALREWSEKRATWVEEDDFNDRWQARYIGAGAEQQVYLSESGRAVIKRNSGFFHDTWLDYFNRLLCHNILFPTTRYIVIGLTTDEGALAVTIEQPFYIL